MKNPVHFIIVDDDAINNMMCKFSISRHFGRTKVSAFEKPQTALQWIAHTSANSTQPAILFLDLDMPTMSGWAFLEHFATFPEGIRAQYEVYILSGSSNLQDKTRAEAHPFVKGFLRKPLTALTLAGVFRELPDSFGVRCFA